MRGESGRNEFLRGPFALFEAHSRAKFVRNLIKHGWASISPPELIPPTSPVQVFAGGRKTQAEVFADTGHGPFRALIVSNLKWGELCRDHYVLTRETLSGRRPADGADTPGGVFRSGENLPGEGDTADIFWRRRRE